MDCPEMNRKFDGYEHKKLCSRVTATSKHSHYCLPVHFFYLRNILSIYVIPRPQGFIMQQLLLESRFTC